MHKHTYISVPPPLFFLHSCFIVCMLIRICIAFSVDGRKESLWIDGSVVFQQLQTLHLLLDHGESARISGGQVWAVASSDRKLSWASQRVRVVCLEQLAQVNLKWCCSLNSRNIYPLTYSQDYIALLLWIPTNTLFRPNMGKKWNGLQIYCSYTCTIQRL